MTPTEYLEAEFRRYFRDASAITVEFSTDEEIIVSILYPDDPEHLLTVNWVCEIGSDDDWYAFRHNSIDYLVITVPLEGDALED